MITQRDAGGGLSWAFAAKREKTTRQKKEANRGKEKHSFYM